MSYWNLLFAEADIVQAQKLNTLNELEAIQKALGKLHVSICADANKPKVEHELRDSKINVLHVTAHGNALGDLLFADSSLVTPHNLAEWLTNFPNLQLVLLNACSSDKAAKQVALASGMTCIGFVGDLENDLAIKFASTLHTGLSSGERPWEAFKKARDTHDATNARLYFGHRAQMVFDKKAWLDYLPKAEESGHNLLNGNANATFEKLNADPADFFIRLDKLLLDRLWMMNNPDFAGNWARSYWQLRKDPGPIIALNRNDLTLPSLPKAGLFSGLLGGKQKQLKAQEREAYNQALERIGQADDALYNTMNQGLVLWLKTESKHSPAAKLLDTLFQWLDEANPGGPKFGWLLGDAGAGKSSTMLHLFASLVSRRHDIKVVYAECTKQLDAVWALPDKHKTILLLDSFDEAYDAFEDGKAFLDSIERYAKDFKKVLLACRDDYWPDTQAVPAITGPYACTSTGTPFKYQLFEIAGLNHNDIMDYASNAMKLRMRTPGYDFIYRLASSGGLLSRPLVLQMLHDYLPDFNDVQALGNTWRNDYELFSFIIGAWEKREERVIMNMPNAVPAGFLLREFMEEFCLKLYDQETVSPQASTGIDPNCLPEFSFLELLEEQELTRLACRDLLLDRGLLRQKGSMKAVYFKHRSIKEFFMAELLLKGWIPEYGFPHAKYKRAWSFYTAACNQQFKGHKADSLFYERPAGYKPEAWHAFALDCFLFHRGLNPVPSTGYVNALGFGSLQNQAGAYALACALAREGVEKGQHSFDVREIYTICENSGLNKAAWASLLGFKYLYLQELPHGKNRYAFVHGALPLALYLHQTLGQADAQAPTCHNKHKRHFAPEWAFLTLRVQNIQLLADNKKLENTTGDWYKSCQAAAVMNYNDYHGFVHRLVESENFVLKLAEGQSLDQVLDLLPRFKALYCEPLPTAGHYLLSTSKQPDVAALLNALAEQAPAKPEFVTVKGGTFTMGFEGDIEASLARMREPGFVNWEEVNIFDEEAQIKYLRWLLGIVEQEHPVEVNSFKMARDCVSLAEYARFVLDKGYKSLAEQEYWSVVSYDKNTPEGSELSYFLQVGASFLRDERGDWVSPSRASYPVLHVSWWDAIAYCNYLNEREGYGKVYNAAGQMLRPDGQVAAHISEVTPGYRLPTEAEWEYAAKDGPIQSKTWFSGTNNYKGNVNCFVPNTEHKVLPLTDLKGNQLGIRAMSGNVLEWCYDWFSLDYYQDCLKESENNDGEASDNPQGALAGSNRVLRGGSWGNNPMYCRVSYRYNGSPSGRHNGSGFRLVLP